MSRTLLLRCAWAAALATTATSLALTIGPAANPAGASSAGSLESRIASAQSRAGELAAGIGADSHQIAGYQGAVADAQARLSALETSLQIERGELERLKGELSTARTQMAALQAQLAHDKQVLIAQLIAGYEAPPPSIATVILQAHGFADLIERFDDLRAISSENAQATERVAAEHRAVTEEAKRLATLEARQQVATNAALAQRDEVAQLHLTLVEHQLRYVHARAAKQAQLNAMRSSLQGLEHELATAQARELAASGNALAYTGPVGAVNLQTEGEWGFFPAAGTNYSVGEEPQIAARLNTLGKALHLHLIGISGYRTPQHSVEVGGFADDPHTRGEASDTPGVEGVPEATLERFGLTRPFGGAAEADHIQLH